MHTSDVPNLFYVLGLPGGSLVLLAACSFAVHHLWTKRERNRKNGA